MAHHRRLVEPDDRRHRQPPPVLRLGGLVATAADSALDSRSESRSLGARRTVVCKDRMCEVLSLQCLPIDHLGSIGILIHDGFLSLHENIINFQ